VIGIGTFDSERADVAAAPIMGLVATWVVDAPAMGLDPPSFPVWLINVINLQDRPKPRKCTEQGNSHEQICS